jgi:alkylhydroperoxidase family enzyme
MPESARIPPLEAPFPPEVAEELSQMMPPGMPPIALFRTIAHNPRVLRKLRGSNLLDRGTLSLRQRELVILRTTARCRSSYEWGVHVAAFTHKTKLTPEQIDATAAADSDAACWEPRERLLLALVDELHETHTCSSASFDRLRASFSVEQLIELVALVGLYHTVSFFTNAFAIEAEPNAPRLPNC